MNLIPVGELKPRGMVLNVWLILAQHPIRGWIRVGPIYFKKSVAQDWRKFVKAAWHGLPTRIKHECIPRIGNTTTDRVKAKFSERYGIDID